MADNESYNGWTNRETWALMLHINNDQGLHEEFQAVVQAAANDGDDQYQIEDQVRESVESYLNPAEYRDEFGESQPEALGGHGVRGGQRVARGLD